MTSHAASGRGARPRPYLLWGSAIVFAAALMGNVASGLFVHRAPGYLAGKDKIIAFYTHHHVSGWSTVVCSAIAYFAFAGFCVGVSSAMKGLQGTGKWPSRILHFLFVLGALGVAVGYLVFRVGALSLGLLNARTVGGAHPYLHQENIAVNAGTAVINIGFLVFIIACGFTLIIFARQQNLKVLGGLMMLPGLACLVLLGFGVCLWVLASAVWLGIHEYRRLRASRADQPARSSAVPA